MRVGPPEGEAGHWGQPDDEAPTSHMGCQDVLPEDLPISYCA